MATKKKSGTSSSKSKSSSSTKTNSSASSALKAGKSFVQRQADPPVSYNFMVAFAPDGMSGSAMKGMATMASLAFDAAFTQISGLGAELEYDTIKSGGFNNQVYHLPKGVKRSGLTLKRGLASIASPLLRWCFQTLEEPKFLTPKTMVVMLLNKNPSLPPVMVWTFYNVIPVKWEINELDAKKSDIVIESIEVVFSKMEII
jgi:phage tail-like protein